MKNMVSLTAERVRDIVQKNGCISLSALEKTVDASFNLIFLAVDHLVMNQAVVLRKNRRDYVICMKGGEG